MESIYPLGLAAVLFGIGLYGVLARRNAVMILASVELMLNACNINFIVFAQAWGEISGQIMALFVIAIAAAEVGIGLGIVLLIYRNRVNINVDEANAMKG